MCLCPGLPEGAAVKYLEKEKKKVPLFVVSRDRHTRQPSNFRKPRDLGNAGLVIMSNYGWSGSTYNPLHPKFIAY